MGYARNRQSHQLIPGACASEEECGVLVMDLVDERGVEVSVKEDRAVHAIPWSLQPPRNNLVILNEVKHALSVSWKDVSL